MYSNQELIELVDILRSEGAETEWLEFKSNYVSNQDIANQPIVFNIRYTPYRLTKNATEKDIAKHQSDRAFYDLSGGENLLKYIATESKRAGKITAIDYFQKARVYSIKTV